MADPALLADALIRSMLGAGGLAGSASALAPAQGVGSQPGSQTESDAGSTSGIKANGLNGAGAGSAGADSTRDGTDQTGRKLMPQGSDPQDILELRRLLLLVNGAPGAPINVTPEVQKTETQETNAETTSAPTTTDTQAGRGSGAPTNAAAEALSARTVELNPLNATGSAAGIAFAALLKAKDRTGGISAGPESADSRTQADPASADSALTASTAAQEFAAGAGNSALLRSIEAGGAGPLNRAFTEGEAREPSAVEAKASAALTLSALPGRTRDGSADKNQNQNSQKENRGDTPLSSPEIAGLETSGAMPMGPLSSGPAIFGDTAQATPAAPSLEDNALNPPTLPEAGATLKARIHELVIQVNQADAAPVDLQVKQQQGQVHVTVRTGDHALESSLRDALPDLVASLDRAGFESETFTPGAAGPTGTLAPAETTPGNPQHDASGTPRRDSSDSPAGNGQQRQQTGSEHPSQQQRDRMDQIWFAQMEQ